MPSQNRYVTICWVVQSFLFPSLYSPVARGERVSLGNGSIHEDDFRNGSQNIPECFKGYAISPTFHAFQMFLISPPYIAFKQTLNVLPSHLLTPFNGPVPPSNLLEKIVRGVAVEGPTDWPVPASSPPHAPPITNFKEGAPRIASILPVTRKSLSFSPASTKKVSTTRTWPTCPRPSFPQLSLHDLLITQTNQSEDIHRLPRFAGIVAAWMVLSGLPESSRLDVGMNCRAVREKTSALRMVSSFPKP